MIYPDTDYAVVAYKNYKVSTFDLNSGEKLDTLQAAGISKSYGKDSSNLYISDLSTTYAIDPEGMFLFEVYSMVGLTDDKNQLILSYRVRDDNNNIVDKYVTVPIYSTDDLIAKGKQIVKYYGN